MEILHIIRSAPDLDTEKMVRALSDQKSSRVIRLYETQADWEGIVDEIFRSKQVVCWW